MQVEYSYETTDGVFINIPLKKRITQSCVCPVCGKKFTLNDIDNDVVELGGYYLLTHRACSKEFFRLKMIDEITEHFESVFDSYMIDEENRFTWNAGAKSIRYKLIPNEYCSRECCSNRPWFMFHTPIGDIKIGWRKRVISIQWQDSYPEFDLSIFDSEDVTKCIGKNDVEPGSPVSSYREIHAHNIDKMYEYLRLARNAVLPNKKKE